jgi:hypothetical protein
MLMQKKGSENERQRTYVDYGRMLVLLGDHKKGRALARSTVLCRQSPHHQQQVRRVSSQDAVVGEVAVVVLCRVSDHDREVGFDTAVYSLLDLRPQ